MPTAHPNRRRRPTVTGRALVLGALVIVLLVVLASPLHRYFASRSAVNQAAQQLHQDQAELAKLEHAKQQWSDPGYIQQQARIRLQYAMPGDTVFEVVGPGAQPDQHSSAAAKNSSKLATGSTWNTRLWGSIRSAGAVP